MSKLSRRDALKTAAAGLFLPAVVLKGRPSVAGAAYDPMRYATAPVMAEPWTEVVITTTIAASMWRQTWELLNRCIGELNADPFFGCEPGTLAGVTLGWVIREDEAWQVTWKLSSEFAPWPRATTPMLPLLRELTRYSQDKFAWSVTRRGTRRRYHTRHGTGEG